MIIISINLMVIPFIVCFGDRQNQNPSFTVGWYAFYTLVAGLCAYGYYNANTIDQCVGNDMTIYFGWPNFMSDLNRGCSLKIPSIDWAEMVTRDCSNVIWDGNQIFVPIVAAPNVVKVIDSNLDFLILSCIIFGASFLFSMLLHALEFLYIWCNSKKQKQLRYEPFVPRLPDYPPAYENLHV